VVTKGIKNGITFSAITWLSTIKLFRFLAERCFSFGISFLDAVVASDLNKGKLA